MKTVEVSSLAELVSSGPTWCGGSLKWVTPSRFFIVEKQYRFASRAYSWRQDALVAMRPKADVVVDLILSSGAQAHTVMDTFRGIARRVVVASSCDVYRACGVLHGSEEGPLQSVPLTEDSELRTKTSDLSAREDGDRIRKMVPWVDDSYDQIQVERAIMGDSGLPGTVLRLPHDLRRWRLRAPFSSGGQAHR